MADLEKLRLFNTVGAVPPPPAAPMDAGVMPAALPAPAPDAKLKLFNSDLSSPERLQRSMRLGADISPEVAARVLDVEKKSGLPRKYVEENLDELERAVQIKSFDPMHYRQNSPKFTEWLAGDPYKSAFAKKDVALMSTFEQFIGGWSAGREQANPRYLELMAKEHSNLRLTDAEKREVAMLERRQQELGKQLSAVPTGARVMAYGGYAVKQFQDMLEPLITGAAAGTLALPGVGTTAGALSALAAHAFNLERAGAWSEYKNMKDVNGNPLDGELARKAAYATGAINAAIETGSDVLLGGIARRMVPGLKELTDKLGPAAAKQFVRDETKKMLANPSRWKAVAKVGAGVAGGAAVEGAEEIVQNMVSTAVGAGAASMSDQTFAPTDWKKAWGESLEEGGGAAIGSLFLLGPMAGVGLRGQFRKAQEARENQMFFEALGGTMSKSDMVQKLPEAAQDAVASITKDGPAKNIYVPVAAWNSLFQADARAAAQDILGDVAQYDEASQVTGADLVIPTGTYAAKIAGTPLHAQLVPDLRLDQGSLSLREAEQAEKHMADLLKLHAEDAEAAAKKNAPVAAIQQEVYDMVRPFMGEREAARTALLMSARYVTRAARMGVDPTTLWQKEGPVVMRDLKGGMSKEALDQVNAFAEFMRENKLTMTGQTWSKPGDEMPFYHGGNPSISAFRPRQSGAVFMSPSPSTASEYATRWGARDEAGAVYKVFASARKPFDFENESDVVGIERALEGLTDRQVAAESASQALRGFYTTKARLLEDIRKGSWGAIEHPAVQRAIRAVKHDAFWVMEEGVKNIGIYDPKQIKSATGNRGTYDTTKDSILYQTLPSSVATNVGAALDVNMIRLADLPTTQQDPELFAKLAAAVVEETGMRIHGDPKHVVEVAIQRMADNLLWLYDQVPTEVSARSRLWYDGAQEFAARWAVRWNKTLAQAAGMLAALSPQKDWFMNGTMAERVGDILDTQMDFVWSDRMNAAAFKFLAADIAQPGETANKTAFAVIQGKTLREVVATKNQRAVGMWIRAYDEAYNSSAHAIISPEGQFQGNVMSGQDKEARRAWGDFLAIGKAASIFVDGSAQNISKQIGSAHKVRNFYNNIFNASDPRFTTIDTHAVAAAHLRPFAGSDRAVMKNFGAAGKSSVLGIYGSYPLYYEAYRRAAEARGLLPREMQSVTWEAVRALFPDTFKTAKNKRAVDKIWADVDAGKISPARARSAIKRLVLRDGELPVPSWFAGRVESHLLRDSTYANEREPHRGVQINFEVAPDPRNELLTDRWNALPLDAQQRLSTDVAWNVVAKALAAFGDVNMKGELHIQLGGWAGATNPSFGLWLDPNVSKTKAVQLARLLGHALSQESMSVVSADRFAGSVELGAIVVQGVNDLVAHDLYLDLREAFGADTIGGHTTSDETMVILVGDSALAETLAPRIATHLGPLYTVGASSVHGALFESENSYGLRRESVTKGLRTESSFLEVGDQLRREAASQVEAYLRQVDPDSPGSSLRDAGPLRQEDPVDGARFSRDGSRRDSGGSLAPLAGAPAIKGATGPDPGLVAVAERYARDRGITFTRQPRYVEVDEAFARRLAAAYEAMPHAPQDPRVRAAYEDLIRQTRAQYDALVAAGYEFTFFDDATDPYQGNPWNAMRDLRANRRMAVYGTYAGFGTDGITTGAVADNPLLADTGIEWADQDGVLHPVTANDLFRAVHDAFGHGLEGAGFRAQGEENAWQAHARLFTGPALAALTSETRGQNSWLNYGPYGEQNRTAKVEDTVFAEQKTGLLPSWAWEEGKAKEDPLFQPAYHGTPHEVDRFSLDKVGTGEGAQAYGWGLYFAENAGIAEGYRKGLSRKQIVRKFRDALPDDADFDEVMELVGTGHFSAYQERVLRALQNMDWLGFDYPAQAISAAYRELDNFDPSSELREAIDQSGALYQVDIPDSAVAKMLDWDKPLSEQAPEVLEAIVNLANSLDEDSAFTRAAQDGASGEELYRALEETLQQSSGTGGFYDKEASLMLNDYGVPGIKYLDASSRSAGEGTRNLVVFDDEIITITHKDGKPVTKAERDAFLQRAGSTTTVRGQFAKNQLAVYDAAGNRLGFIDDAQDAQQNMAEAKQKFPGATSLSSRYFDVISLFKSANPSTIWHELSHSWLEELRRDAEGDLATDQLKADWETTKKYLGIANLKPGEPIPRNAHELFARSSEAYVREGNAPSIELRSVFQQFMVWMKQIYKSIRNLIADDEINPQFAAVMDRLLATDEQIEAARQEAAFEATAIPLDKLTKAEAAEYSKLVEDAKTEAEERVRTEAMREIVRERTDWWRAEKAQVTREVEEGINAQPVYRALSWLRSGRLPDGSVLEGIPHQRLDRQALVYQYGDQILKDLSFLYQNDGAHPDTVAELFGFQSGDEMLKAIAEAPPRRQAISSEVDRLMLERHGDMLNDGGLAERAIEAVHSDKQADVLLAELRILKRLGAKGELTTWRAIQDLAASVAGRKMVGDLNPRFYVSAASRAGYEAERAMIGKDYTHAFDAKLQQLVNLAMVQEVTKRKAAVDRALRAWKQLDRSDERLKKSNDLNLVNTARAILGNYAIGRKSESAVSYLELVQEYDPATYDDLIELVKLASAEEKPYTILTADEFAQMQEIVDGIWTLSRMSKRSMVDGQRVARDAIKTDLLNAIAALGNQKKVPGSTQAITERELLGFSLLDVKAAGTRVEHWVTAMDRGDLNGTFRRYIWTPVSEAAAQYRAVQKEVMLKYLSLTRLLDDRMTADKIEAPELNYTFANRAELLGALLHTGNESNLRKLLLGGRPDNPWATVNQDGTIDTSKWDAFIARLQKDSVLTKTDYDFVQGVWDLMESIKPAAQAAHREMYGYYFNEITAKPFNTPWGVYRGGYAPAVTDPMLVDDASRRADMEALQPMMSTFMFPTTGRGFTQSRMDNYTKPLQLNLGLVQQHIDKVLRFTYIEPRVREVGRLLLDKDLRRTIQQYVNPSVVTEMLMPWLERTAQQRVEAPSTSKAWRAVDKVARLLRSRTSAQIMVLNVSNVMQQITGLSTSLLHVERKHLRNALFTYLSSPRETAERIAALSSFMNTRTSASVIEVQQEINQIMIDPSKYEQARAFAAKHGYFLQQTMQNVVDTITWLGAYNQAVATGLDEKTSVRNADAAVRLTQGSFNAEDISRMEAGTAGARLFTMFWSYFNGQANLLGERFASEVRNSGFSAPGRLFYMYVIGFMIPAALAEGIAQAMSGELWDDDDDDGYLDNFMTVLFMGQFKMATAMVPGVGQLVQAAANRWNDKWYDDRVSVSPMVSSLDAVAGAPFSVYRAIAEDGSWKRAIKDTLTTIGLATGLPFGVLARPLGYIADVEQGKVEPANAADYARGLITGKGNQQ